MTIGMQQNPSQQRAARPLAHALGDAGAAMVEFALVLLILAMFVFGIISFGYLFSFRQNMTQAAAEGARAGAVAATANQGTDATTAVQGAIKNSFGKDCGTNGLTCTINGVVAGGTIPTVACTNDATHNCITVTLTYDYRNYPLLPDAPVISSFMPSTITVSSIARVS